MWPQSFYTYSSPEIEQALHLAGATDEITSGFAKFFKYAMTK